MTVDEKLDKAGDALESKADTLAPQGGLKARLAAELADDADFLRKLKPSLIKARAQGRAPKNAKPGKTRPVPTGPQLGERTKTKKSGGPNPWLVLGAALAAGIGIAKALDWRGHAHPRD
jgi:hypothetical protein